MFIDKNELKGEKMNREYVLQETIRLFLKTLKDVETGKTFAQEYQDFTKEQKEAFLDFLTDLIEFY